MRTFVTYASAKERVLHFVSAYEAAPNDADIELRVAQLETESGKLPAVHISINGDEHALTADEARRVAKVFERVIQHAPDFAEQFANIIMGLRAAADKAEARPSTGGKP